MSALSAIASARAGIQNLKRQRGGSWCTHHNPFPRLRSLKLRFSAVRRAQDVELVAYFVTRSVSEGSWCTNVSNSLAYASGYD